MKKVFFIGSEQDDTDKDLFREICRELGYIFLTNGYEVILGSDTVNTSDYWIFQGMKKYCEENKPGKLILHSILAENEKFPFTSQLNNKLIQYLKIETHRYLKEYEIRDGIETSTKAYLDYVWAPAHVGSINQSDVVIPICGSFHTRRACHFAVGMNTPVVPIPNLGGASYIYFRTQIGSFYKKEYKKFGMSDRKNDWELGQSGEKFVSFVNECIIRHNKRITQRADNIRKSGRRETESTEELKGFSPFKYFLSYSHENIDHADQLELLMHREKMELLRDTEEIEPGDNVFERIKDLIKASDYFIALVSHSYRGSEYCQKELQYVKGLPEKNGPKIIYLKVGSDKAITEEMEETRCPDARNIKEKKEVVQKIKNGTLSSKCLD